MGRKVAPHFFGTEAIKNLFSVSVFIVKYWCIDLSAVNIWIKSHKISFFMATNESFYGQRFFTLPMAGRNNKKGNSWKENKKKQERSERRKGVNAEAFYYVIWSNVSHKCSNREPRYSLLEEEPNRKLAFDVKWFVGNCNWPRGIATLEFNYMFNLRTVIYSPAEYIHILRYLSVFDCSAFHWPDEFFSASTIDRRPLTNQPFTNHFWQAFPDKLGSHLLSKHRHQHRSG